MQHPGDLLAMELEARNLTTDDIAKSDFEALAMKLLIAHASSVVRQSGRIVYSSMFDTIADALGQDRQTWRGHVEAFNTAITASRN